MFINKSGTGVASHATLHTYSEGYLLPILAQDELLLSPRHRGLLRQFYDLAALSQSDFDAIYGKLIQNFLEFVQIIPHKRGGVLGSLMNYGLARASAVFQKYCQLQKEETTPLLKFAVFSAALLKNIGRVVSRQRIILTTENGDYIEDWNPLSGSMVHRAPYFKMYPINTQYLRIETEVTPLIARQLIPDEAFLWLSSDLSVFSDWLAALLDEEGVGAKQITWALMLIKREDIIAILSSLEGANPDRKLSIATEYGEEFYRWLRNSIEDGSLDLNDPKSGVALTREGLFIENGVFFKFARLFGLPINAMIIRAQFGNGFGIIKRSGEDFLHANAFGTSDILGGYSTFSATGSAQGKEGIIAPSENVVITKAGEISTHLKTKHLIQNIHRSPAALTALAQFMQHSKRK